jgi:hypothetical protein
MSDKNAFVCPMRGFKKCVGGSCMWAIRFPNGKSSCSVSQIAVNLQRLEHELGAGDGNHPPRKTR